MKVSVIIPVKNRASLLPVTLQNVLNQSLPPHEIIVVDDHSSDAISDVINQYKTAVIFIKSNGNGPGAARNTGFNMSTGNAIQFFDSDDLMTKNKLQVQADLLEKKEADFVYGPYVKAIFESGVWKQADAIMQYKPLPDEQLYNLVLQGWCPITQSTMFSRDLVVKAGAWKEDLLTHEDYEYWFRISKLAKKMYHENESCVIYRQHQKQITDLDVSVKARWLDGLTAMKYIQNQIDFTPQHHSYRLFKGRYGLSKISFIKKYGNEQNMQVAFADKIDAYYYKFFNKINRLQTGTSWQKMQGVLPIGNKKFHAYIDTVI